MFKVSHTASLKEIKKSFRKLAMEFHPDKNKDEVAQVFGSSRVIMGWLALKGGDRQCMVVELRLQYCWTFLGFIWDLLTFLRCIFVLQERINAIFKTLKLSILEGYFENLFKLFNENDEKCNYKFYSKHISCLGTGWENNSFSSNILFS